MKQVSLLFSAVLLFSQIAVAASKYWVGPINGSWSVAANWSLRPFGVGGAGAPTYLDDVDFIGSVTIKMDVSPVVKSIYTEAGHTWVKLITSNPTTITILELLSIGPDTYMTDSTTANVPFNVYFKTGARAQIFGNWTFRGSVPVSFNNGASFTAPEGSFVKVSGLGGLLTATGSITLGKYSRPIVSTATTLSFDNNSGFEADEVKDVVIPDALWAKDSLVFYYGTRIIEDPATIRILKSFSSITYAGSSRDYGAMWIDLPLQQGNVSLALQHGTKFSGFFEVNNTNNYRLTLLAGSSPTSTVTVEIGTTATNYFYNSRFGLYGSTTNVSMANAGALAPATSYKIIVEKDFLQTGGNFSLQDYDLATGSSTLDIKGNFTETGGTFYTNSTSISPTAEFRVIMDDPRFYAGPSGDFQSSRTLTVSSGTLDNGRNMVILRIDHTCYTIPGSSMSNLNGVILRSALRVGKLELMRSPLTTTATWPITVTNPSPGAIVTGSSNSYVNGPLRRFTNNTEAYIFPVGQGNTAAYGYFQGTLQIIPGTTSSSSYEAQYFNSGYGSIAVTAPLQGVSTNKYFNVERIYGADASIILHVNGVVTGATATKGIVVAGRSTDGRWIKRNGTVLTPGTATSGSVVSERLSAFGIFTFGYGLPDALYMPSKFTLKNIAQADSRSFSEAILSQEEKGSVLIYPNPFKNKLTVDFYNANGAGSNADLNIYNAAGVLIYTKPLNNLSAGRNITHLALQENQFTGNSYQVRLYINGLPGKTLKLLKK